MNKQEFMKALRDELSKLPPEEIDEATEYFEECFAEATDGLDPEKAAAEEARLAEEFGSPKRIAAQIRADYAARILDGEQPAAASDTGKTGKLSAVWWVVIGICSAPIALPLVIVLIAMIFVVIACIIGGVIGGAAAVVAGLIHLAATPSSGVLITGIGLMILSGALAAGYGAIVGIIALGKSLSEKSKQKAENESKEAEINEESK